MSKRRNEEMEEEPIDPVVLEENEKKFQWKQAKNRASIRIHQQRAKPIDVIITNFDEACELYFDEISDEPWLLLFLVLGEKMNQSAAGEISSFRSDLLSLAAVTPDAGLEKFIKSFLIVLEDEESKTAKQKNPDWKGTIGINEDLYAEINEIFGGKSLDELLDLENSMKERISEDGPVDIEYWENLLKEIQVFKAKAVMKICHDNCVLNKVHQLVDEKAKLETAKNLLKPYLISLSQAFSKSFLSTSSSYLASSSVSQIKNDDSKSIPADYSKKDDEGESEGVRFKDDSKTATDWFLSETKRPFFHDEEEFNEEAEGIARKRHTWQDKHAPKKPLYHNRVTKIYDWNRYNKVHYSYSNPPPKIAIAFKFLILYAEALDKSDTPRYKIEKDPDSPTGRTKILRFIGPAPYEDILFRIPDDEWDISHKKGFLCSYDRGVLRLNFCLKRVRYRR